MSINKQLTLFALEMGNKMNSGVTTEKKKFPQVSPQFPVYGKTAENVISVKCERKHDVVPLGLRRDNGWFCNGVEKGRCLSDFGEDFRSLNKRAQRFRCWQCDYDLCEKCYEWKKLELEQEYDLSEIQTESSVIESIMSS